MQSSNCYQFNSRGAWFTFVKEEAGISAQDSFNFSLLGDGSGAGLHLFLDRPAVRSLPTARAAAAAYSAGKVDGCKAGSGRPLTDENPDLGKSLK